MLIVLMHSRGGSDHERIAIATLAGEFPAAAVRTGGVPIDLGCAVVCVWGLLTRKLLQIVSGRGRRAGNCPRIFAECPRPSATKSSSFVPMGLNFPGGFARYG